jgi:exosortase
MLYKIFWLLIGALYFPVFNQLYRSRWEFIDYTHAYFILPASLWLIWRQRKTLARQYEIPVIRHCEKAAACGRRSNLGVLFLFILSLLMYLFGWRMEFLFITTLSLIPVSWSAARYLYGPTVSRLLAFPLLYLLFLVPPPLGVLDAVTVPMRYGISQLTELILRAAGFPIVRTGLLMTIGGREIYMGAPCSGFRSLITMLALASLYVHIIPGMRLKKIILILAVIPLALVGNLVRVITICLITYYAGHEAAEGFFHYFSGTVIFVIMLAGLMLLERLIDRGERTRSSR